jgi:hypothetical protein
MNKLGILGLMLVGAVTAQAGLVTLDFRGGLADNTVFYRSYDVTGITGVTALFTADLPVSGSASTFTTSGAGGANGIGMTGGIDNSDFDNGETFRLSVQLYTGYTDENNRGTEVTDLYTVSTLGASMRIRTTGSYGLALTNTVGGVGTSFDVVTPEADGVGSSNTTVDYSFGPLAVTSPLIVTSIGNDNGAPYVQQLKTMDFNIIPEPATLGLVAAMGGGLLFIRRRFMM